MVKTGRRARELASRLAPILGPVVAPPSAPRLHDLDPGLADSIKGFFVALGGELGGRPSLRPGGWDLAFADGLLIELDEELHFNRYRALTLGADWAERLPWTIDYRRQAIDGEAACLAAGGWGKRWTNNSCEAMFGPASSPGDFARGGAPRWKQRALYDALKDAYAMSGSGYRLARLSLHDDVGGRNLAQELERPAETGAESLADLLERRIHRID